jgi:hypothetical protein
VFWGNASCSPEWLRFVATPLITFCVNVLAWLLIAVLVYYGYRLLVRRIAFLTPRASTTC